MMRNAEENLRQGFSGEKGVQDATIIRVDFASEEDPVVLFKNLLGRMHQTRLGIGRAVENLTRVVIRRCHDDKTDRSRGPIA